MVFRQAYGGADGMADGRSVSVSVVVPTLNEAENLPHVLGRIPAEYEVVIVDGASFDGTINVALECRPDAKIVTQTRSGKGNALVCGFEAATGEILVMLDADGSARPEEIPAFVSALLAGADFAKGSRFLDGGGSADITPLRHAGNSLLGACVNVLYGTHYTDLCYGFNAFWRECLDVLSLDCDGFEVETVINIRIAKASLRVVEVPSFEDCRIHGDSHLRVPRDGLRILRTILREKLIEPLPREAKADSIRPRQFGRRPARGIPSRLRRVGGLRASGVRSVRPAIRK